MRIVAVADTHTFEADLGQLPEGDVLIHAGDLVRAGDLEELAPVAEWLRSQPHPYKIVVAGNHDWCFVREPERARGMLGESVTYLQDSGCTLEGVRVWGSPWQPAFNDWAFNLPRGQALAERWALIPEDTDLLITHGPPAGIGDRGPVPGRLGCDALRARCAVVAPALHVFGHIHTDGGLFRHDATAHLNATTWECERAASVVDLDPATGEVTPVSIPPRSDRD